MGEYRSRAWYERQDRKYDWQNIGIVAAILTILFAVPVILLWGFMPW